MSNEIRGIVSVGGTILSSAPIEKRGLRGIGIRSIELTGTVATDKKVTRTYTITFDDGDTFSYDVVSVNEEYAESVIEGAEAAQTASESARDISISAKNDAVSAKNDAVSAKNDAQTARTGSEAARDTAISAKNDAVSAKNDAETAQGLAEDARDDAIEAKEKAEDMLGEVIRYDEEEISGTDIPINADQLNGHQDTYFAKQSDLDTLEAEVDLNTSERHSHGNKSVLDTITQAMITAIGTIADKYVKPTGGIPKTDLADGVKESLELADNALQIYNIVYTEEE